MIYNDFEISRQAIRCAMIRPFTESKISDGVVSYGLSSFGYDARLSGSHLLLVEANDTYIALDPKNFDRGRVSVLEAEDGAFIIPPYGFALGCTVEEFRIPRDTIALCVGKSTYARCGLIVNVTPLEPEWCGKVTLELHNTTGRHIKVYANEGICQFMFFRGESCRKSYTDHGGKYQGQTEVTLPIVI
jgi:dCTP deaminase